MGGRLEARRLLTMLSRASQTLDEGAILGQEAVAA